MGFEKNPVFVGGIDHGAWINNFPGDIHDILENTFPIVNFRRYDSKTDRVKGVDLESNYHTNNEETGRINLLEVEEHGFYKVAVIEIQHRYPGKKYLHKGNKFNPDTGKYDGEITTTPKVSAGSSKTKKYRIQYSTDELVSHRIYCYGGEVRDGKEYELNTNALIPVIKEIEELLAQS